MDVSKKIAEQYKALPDAEKQVCVVARLLLICSVWEEEESAVPIFICIDDAMTPSACWCLLLSAAIH